MSNAGVITLASLNEMLKFPFRFEIEDNIGEAIHIHYKDIRLDMTIKEFDAFADEVRIMLASFLPIKSLKLDFFDENNLVLLFPYLLKATDCDVQEMYLEEVIVDCIEDGKVVYKPLSNSRVLKALNLDTLEDDNNVQTNFFDSLTHHKQTNNERTKWTFEKTKNLKSWWGGDNLLTVNGYNNRIIDGQHRAAALYHMYGNIKVPVRRLFFEMHDDYSFEGNPETKTIYDYYDELQKRFAELERENADLCIERENLIHTIQEKDNEISENIGKNRENLAKCEEDLKREKERIQKVYEERTNSFEALNNRKDSIISEKERRIKDNQNRIREMQFVIDDLNSQVVQLRATNAREEATNFHLNNDYYRIRKLKIK